LNHFKNEFTKAQDMFDQIKPGFDKATKTLEFLSVDYNDMKAKEGEKDDKILKLTQRIKELEESFKI